MGLIKDYNKIYTLQTWVEGIPLEENLKNITKEELYQLGIQSAKILKNIHNIKLDNTKMVDSTTIIESIRKEMDKYKKCKNKLENDNLILDFIENNINNEELYQNFAYLHGDFQICNFIYTNKKELGVIDFERCKIGNTYEDFFSIVFYNREISTHFINGMLKEYFGENPPKEFWKQLLFYCATGSITALLWATLVGEKEVNECKQRVSTMMKDFNNFEKLVPDWFN